jgi:hypothetical protein
MSERDPNTHYCRDCGTAVSLADAEGHECKSCPLGATMVVYLPERVPFCTKHGTPFSEDAGRSFSYLRPRDPPEACSWPPESRS